MKILIGLLVCLSVIAAQAVIKTHIQGVNSDVDLAAAEDIWSEGGDYPFPTAANATTIVSASAADAAAGTGARTVKVTGIKADLYEVTETVTLNGTTPVTLVNVYSRINDAQVMTAGSGTTNAGKLSLKHSSTVIGAIEAGIGRTRTCVFTTGKNFKQWAIKRIYAGLTNGTQAAVTVQILSRKTGAVWQVRDSVVVNAVAAYQGFELMAPILLDQSEDIRLRSTTTADNAAVIGGMDIWYGAAGIE